MRIERVISWFDKSSEELLGEYNIDYIDLEVLKKIFVPKKEDPLMYDPYTINYKESRKIKPYLTNFVFDFEKFIYQVDCFQV